MALYIAKVCDVYIEFQIILYSQILYIWSSFVYYIVFAIFPLII